MKRIILLFCTLTLCLTACATQDTVGSTDSTATDVLPLLSRDPSGTKTADPPTTTLFPATTGTTTQPQTTKAPTATTQPQTTKTPVTVTPPPKPPVTGYQEDHTIVYAKPGTVLTVGEQTVEVEADCAMIRTGIGESTARVIWQGQIAYVPSEQITEEMPASAVQLSAEKGGIYYKGTGPLVAIDAGHQNRAMTDKEPLGPGSTEMKNKLSSGTQGVATRLEEYKLNLSVALLLRDELIGRGYSVLMIRESNDVRLSNADRAKIANAYNADAFIRIHANGSDDSSARGAFTLCQTKKNPYNGTLYEKSRALAEDVLSGYLGQTGFSRDEIWETDTMPASTGRRPP